jgi:hypothetical protein
VRGEWRLPALPGLLAARIGVAVASSWRWSMRLRRRCGPPGTTRPANGTLGTQRNPFDFWPAVGFAAIGDCGHHASSATGRRIEQFGNAGASMALIGFTGLYDVDAALIAAANLAHVIHAPGFAACWGCCSLLPILANNRRQAGAGVSRYRRGAARGGGERRCLAAGNRAAHRWRR